MRAMYVACGAIMLAACSRSARDVPDSARFVTATGGADTATRWVVSPSSIGPIHAGVSLDEAAAFLGPQADVSLVRHQACAMLHVPALPPGVSLMVVRDTVVRIDVDSAGVVTQLGIGVGDNESGVSVLYSGRVKTEASKATALVGGRVLTVTPQGDLLHLLVFEIEGGVVHRFHSGLRPFVDHVAHC